LNPKGFKTQADTTEDNKADFGPNQPIEEKIKSKTDL